MASTIFAYKRKKKSWQRIIVKKSNYYNKVSPASWNNINQLIITKKKNKVDIDEINKR